MAKWLIEWIERKKAIVYAKNEEEAEQKAYDLPDIEVHQETVIRNLEKLKKVI